MKNLAHLLLVTVLAAPGADALAYQDQGIQPVVDFTSCPRPEYPLEAKKEQRKGTVEMDFHVNAAGTVLANKLRSSSGHADLDDAALSALAKCQFKPGSKRGKAAEMWTTVQFIWDYDQFSGVPGGPAFHYKPCSRPEYPRGALRDERTGIVTLSFLVGIEGSVKESRLVRSSGHQDLDEAARIGLSKCPFKPAAADLDGDGRLDLVTTNNNGSVSVLLQRCLP